MPTPNAGIGLRLKDQPQAERPRERLRLLGPDALSPAELIAILLRTGLRGMNAVELGKQLMQRFGSLQVLASVPLERFCEIKGIGPDKAVTLTAAFGLARRLAREQPAEPLLMDTPESVASLLREDARAASVETFHVLLLNTRRRLLGIHKVSDGTLDTLLVHPREVFRQAILHNASALVLAHNHPSGDPSPSEADIKITRDLIRAGQLLKIEVLDHVILGRLSEARSRDFVSLRELGYFY